MDYRTNKRTGDKIRALGFGTAYICEAPEDEAVATIRKAFEGGVNYFDLATSDKVTFSCFRKALGDVRDQVMYQIHFGADYSAGEYGWTTDGRAIRESVRNQLEELGTDYIDYGFIHCMDEEADWEYQPKLPAMWGEKRPKLHLPGRTGVLKG